MRMHRLLFAVTAAATVLLSAPAMAQDVEKPPVPSIAIIDVDKVIEKEEQERRQQNQNSTR